MKEKRYYVTKLGVLFSEEILGYYTTIGGAQKRFKKAIEKGNNSLETACYKIVDMWTNAEVQVHVIKHVRKDGKWVRG